MQIGLEEKYNFGYKRNQQRLESEILQLPTDSDGNPNWDYMSKFMQNNEMEKLSKTLEYIYKLAISKGIKLFGKLNETEWQGFWIEDILKSIFWHEVNQRKSKARTATIYWCYRIQ